MQKFITTLKAHSAVLRAVAIVSIVGALVTSVTYASLQSQSATLTGNTIQTASASLLIGTASATSTAFSATHSGFTFSGIVPGSTPSADNIFYLKNTGTASLALKLAVGSTPTNAANVDLTKVNVNITRVDTATSQTFTLASLIDGYPTSGQALTDSLAPTTAGATQYKISVSMATDAFNGTSASIGAIDFVFSGSAAL